MLSTISILVVVFLDIVKVIETSFTISIFVIENGNGNEYKLNLNSIFYFALIFES